MNIKRVVLLVSLFTFNAAFSQKLEFSTGLGFCSSHNETAAYINFGVNSKHHYNQISYIYGVYLHVFLITQMEKALPNRSGIGYVYRYYPNNKHSRIISFLEGGASYQYYHVTNASNLFDSLTQTNIAYDANRKLMNIYLGYGLGINFLHHFTFSNTIGSGFSYLTGVNTYKNNILDPVRYKNTNRDIRIVFTVQYHYGRF
jgi:hypothetical protein